MAERRAKNNTFVRRKCAQPPILDTEAKEMVYQFDGDRPMIWHSLKIVAVSIAVFTPVVVSAASPLR